jgi:hypothetical protein
MPADYPDGSMMMQKKTPMATTRMAEAFAGY